MSKQEKYQKAIAKHGNNFTLSEFSLRDGTSAMDIDYNFFEVFNRFRQWTGYPTLITSAYRPGDSGAHGQGLALDFIMFSKWKEAVVPPWEQWRLATTWPFWGVGIYFDWHYWLNGQQQPAVGLHVDFKQSGSRPLRWLRVEDDNYDKLYYYQNTKHGKFYNSTTEKSLQLADVIKSIWQD